MKIYLYYLLFIINIALSSTAQALGYIIAPLQGLFISHIFQGSSKLAVNAITLNIFFLNN